MRKRCQTCGAILVAANGHYLHPETLCSGLGDGLYISYEVEDDFIYKKFKEVYGTPKIDDHDLLNKIFKNPILRFLVWVFIR